MKKIIICFLIVAIIFITACKKSGSESVAPHVPACLVTATIDSLTKDTTSVFIYDSEGRLSKEQHFNKNVRANYYYYIYNPGTIKQLYYNDKDEVEDTAYYTLNADGAVAKETYKGGVGRFDTLLFTYLNGYLKTVIHKSVKGAVVEADTFNYEYSGENMTKYSYIKNGVVGYSYEYTYTGLEDKVGLGLFGDISIPGLFGKANAKLILTETYTNVEDPVGNYKQSYSYKVDSNGLPSYQKMTTDYGNANEENNLFATRCR